MAESGEGEGGERRENSEGGELGEDGQRGEVESENSWLTGRLATNTLQLQDEDKYR